MEQAFAAAVDAEYSRTLARCHELAHFRPAIGRLAEAADEPVGEGGKAECEWKIGDCSQPAGDAYPAVADFDQRLVIPEATGSRNAEPEPLPAGVRIHGVRPPV